MSRGRLAVGLLVSALIVLPLVGNMGAVSAATTPTLASVSLRASDVPGFSPVDPSLFTFQDPEDQGFAQAFISCAGSTPLLSQFDSGPDADVSQAYGQGQNPFGTPETTIATAVFSDGTNASAQLAYEELASLSFQNCWAQQNDALNAAQGLTVPITPTTIAALPTPRYGHGTTGFYLNMNYSVLGQSTFSSLEATVIWSGSLVTLLLILNYQGTFPETARLALVQQLAGRMDASSPPSACQPLNTPIPSSVLISNQQVGQDVGATVAFQGEDDYSNEGTNGPAVPSSSCGWRNPHASSVVSNRLPLPKGYLSAGVTVTGPFTSDQAAYQYYNQIKTPWSPAKSQPGLGNAAFYTAEQDNASSLLVLDNQYLFQLSVETDGKEGPSELALAKTVLGHFPQVTSYTSPDLKLVRYIPTLGSLIPPSRDLKACAVSLSKSKINEPVAVCSLLDSSANVPTPPAQFTSSSWAAFVAAEQYRGFVHFSPVTVGCINGKVATVDGETSGPTSGAVFSEPGFESSPGFTPVRGLPMEQAEGFQSLAGGTDGATLLDPALSSTTEITAIKGGKAILLSWAGASRVGTVARAAQYALTNYDSPFIWSVLQERITCSSYQVAVLETDFPQSNLYVNDRMVRKAAINIAQTGNFIEAGGSGPQNPVGVGNLYLMNGEHRCTSCDMILNGLHYSGAPIGIGTITLDPKTMANHKDLGTAILDSHLGAPNGYGI